MYKFNRTDAGLTTLLANVFPRKPERFYANHPDFLALLRHLHLANEVRSLMVTFDYSQHRYGVEYHYVGETFDEAKQRAIAGTHNIVYAIYELDTHHGWRREDFELLETCGSLKDLLVLALGIAERVAHGVGFSQVCGPISSGGRGNVPDNLWAFHRTIQTLRRSTGEKFFDQMPFEPSMHLLHDKWRAQGGAGYWMEVLEEFYLPLFESGMVQKVYFMPGWESSRGARWEHEQTLRLGIEHSYLLERSVPLVVPLLTSNKAVSY